MDLTNQNSNEMTCEYCGKSFKRKHAFEVHVCTKKQRALQRDEKRVRYGLYAYNRFNRLSAGKKSEATYEQFCNSQYYNAFVKFGSYISNVRPLYPERYIDYVVTSGLKIKDWSKDEVYENYVIDLVKRESAEVAIKRSLDTMIEWAEKNNSEWNHYFDYANSNVAVWNIRDGKMSPWLILNAPKGKNMLSGFDDQQLELIYPIINPDYWINVFKRNSDDLRMINLLSEEFNL